VLCFSTRTIALRATHRLSVSPFMPVGLFGEGFPHPGADQDCVILGERFGRHGVPLPRDRSPRSFLRSPGPVTFAVTLRLVRSSDATPIKPAGALVRLMHRLG
jgi:hypothetical protein